MNVIIQTIMTNAAMIEPPTNSVLLKTTPDDFLDVKPRNITNAAKTNPIKDNAFILIF